MSEAKTFDDLKEMREVFDLFYLAILDIDPDSVLPEMVSILGQQKAMQFLEIFQGTTVHIPKISKIRLAVKNAGIWRDHCKGIPLNEIEDKYSVTQNYVLKTIDRWKVLHKAADA